MKLLVPPNVAHLRQPWCKEKKTVVGFTVGRPPRKLKSTDKNTQDILQELTENIPGLEQVLDSKKGFLFNFIWLLLFLSCFLICLYQISDRCLYFLSTPIGSQVTVVRNVFVKFPMMTICAHERYTELIDYQRTIAKKYNKSLCEVETLETIEILNISTIWDKMNTVGLISTSGVTSRSQLIFSDGVIPPVKNKTTTTLFGTCTTFLEENPVVYRGLDYVINVNLIYNLSVPCLKKNVLAVYTVHTEDITYKLSTLYELLVPNVKIIFGISARRFKRLNRTDAPCNTESFVNQCEKKCIEDFLKTHIECRLPFMSFDDFPLCDNFTSAFLTYSNVYKIATSFSYFNNCVCPKICDHLSIIKSLEGIAGYQPYSSLDVFFHDDIIDTIEEYYSYSFITLLCDVGGNLGLFLGLCVPTVLSTLQSVISLIVKKIYY